MTNAKPPQDPLADFVATTGLSDAAIGRLIGATRWKISRGRRGEPPLSIEDQVALEKFTGVKPAQWAEHYARLVALRAKPQKKSEQDRVAAIIAEVCELEAEA